MAESTTEDLEWDEANFIEDEEDVEYDKQVTSNATETTQITPTVSIRRPVSPVEEKIDPQGLTLFENQRWFPTGWKGPLPTDRNRFSNGDGSWGVHTLPPFAADWKISDEGWRYAFNFTAFSSKDEVGHKSNKGCYVRRRKFIEPHHEIEKRKEETIRSRSSSPNGKTSAIVFENQRWFIGKGWQDNLLPTERNRWSNGDGSFSAKTRPSFMTKYIWNIHTDSGTDKEGYEYATNWGTFTNSMIRGTSSMQSTSLVRRRRWISYSINKDDDELGAFETDSSKANPLLFADLSRSKNVTGKDRAYELLNLASPFSSSMQKIGRCPRRKMLTTNEWQSYASATGCIYDFDLVKKRIFESQISPELRMEIWPLLLGVYPWNSSFEQRNSSFNSLKDLYEDMMLQLQSGDDETEFEYKKEMCLQIERDVNRADRDSACFAGDNNVNLRKLHNILSIYCLVLRKGVVKYHQAMCEFGASLLSVLNDEALTFWCFTKYIEQTRDVWDTREGTNESMDLALNNLMKCLVVHFDPPLFQHLQSTGSDDAVFTYKWLLLNMKHEFDRLEAINLQEVAWSMPMDAYKEAQLELGSSPYIMFISLAVILDCRDVLLKSDYFNICEYMSNLKGKIELTKILETAEWLFWTFTQRRIPSDRRKK